jgi:hypothetical protein
MNRRQLFAGLGAAAIAARAFAAQSAPSALEGLATFTADYGTPLQYVWGEMPIEGITRIWMDDKLIWEIDNNDPHRSDHLWAA